MEKNKIAEKNEPITNKVVSEKLAKSQTEHESYKKESEAVVLEKNEDPIYNRDKSKQVLNFDNGEIIKGSEQDSIDVKDNKQIIINGSEEQKAKMFMSLSKYYEDVTNPENNASNPYFNSKYATLAEVLNHVRPSMGKHGLSIIQVPMVEYNVLETTFGNQKPNNYDLVTIQTVLFHESGAYIAFPSLTGKTPKRNIQDIGSIITYLRRFSLNAIAGTAGEVDDDGNTASNRKAPKAKKTTTSSAKAEPEDDLKHELISACANYTKNDSKKRKEVIEALKGVEPTGNVNKITKKEDIKNALNIVVGLM